MRASAPRIPTVISALTDVDFLGAAAAGAGITTGFVAGADPDSAADNDSKQGTIAP